jgi:hypothetical protein
LRAHDNHALSQSPVYLPWDLLKKIVKNKIKFLLKVPRWLELWPSKRI